MAEDQDIKFMWDGSSGEVYALDMNEEFDPEFPVIPWRPVSEVVEEEEE